MFVGLAISQLHQEWWMLLNVVVAGVLTGLVGLEREQRRKPAGLRTHMTVGIAAAVIVIAAQIMVSDFANGFQNSFIRADPVCAIEAIVTGVSFMCAGTIVVTRQHDSVEGLKTAASLLMATTLGIVVAVHAYLLAGVTTALLVVVLAGIRRIESRVPKSTDTCDTQESE